MIGRNIFSSSQSCSKCHFSFKTLQKAYLKRNGTVQYGTATHKNKFAVFSTVDLSPLNLHIFFKADEDPISNLFFSNFKTTLLLVMLTILSTIFCYITFIRFNNKRITLNAKIDHINKMKEVEDQIKKHNRELTLLNNTSRLISTTTTSFDYIRDIIERVSKDLNFDAGAIYLLNRSNNTLSLSASYGIENNFMDEIKKVKVDDSPLGSIFINGVSKIIRNIDTRDKKVPVAVKEMGLKSVGLFPLGAEKNKLGLLVLSRKNSKNWDNETIKLCVSISNSISVAINNTTLINKLKRRAEEMTTVNEIAKSINSSVNLEEIIKITAEKISHIIPYFKGAIVLTDTDTQRDKIHYMFSSKGIEMKREIDHPSEFAQFWSSADKIYSNNEHNKRIFEWEKKISALYGAKSVIASPLISGKKILGVMSLMNNSEKIYTDEDIRLFRTICEEVSIAINNSTLFKKLDSSHREWENTFNSITELIAIAGKQSGIERANKAFTQKLGAKSFNGKITEFISDDILKTRAEIDSSIYDISSYPIFDGEKNEGKNVLIMEDVSHQERLERDLKESEEKYRKLFETAYDGLLIINTSNQQILNANESFISTCGYKIEELSGAKLCSIFEEINEGEKDMLCNSLKNSKAYACEMIIKRKMKPKRWWR